ncbi:trigger factor [bacterium]|nr:trigger factor [bacterium]
MIDVESDENPSLNRSKMTVEAGRRSAMPGLDKEVLDMRAGEEKTVEINFPEDHFIEDMRGKSAQVKLKVGLIKQRELPQLDDDFAKQARQDTSTIDELKEAIRRDLVERVESESQVALERQINDQLQKENPVEVPESMVRLQAAMMIQGMSQRLSSQGFKMEDLYPDTSALREETMASAENLVKTSLIIEAIAKEHGFEAQEEDIQKEIDKLAARYNMAPELVRQGMEERGSLEEIKFGIVEKKVYNYIIENSNIEEVAQVEESADDAGSDRS